MKRLISSFAFAALTLAPHAVAADAAQTVDKAEAKMGEAKDELKTKFFELVDKETIKVDFDKGKAHLTEGERSDLKALVDSLKTDGTVQSYVVAAWSDKDYPANADTKLSAADKKLAEQRQAAVVKALKSLGVKTVESHTMAERPTWMAKTFGMNDATIKGARQADGDAEQQHTERLAEQIKSKGGPGKVVVIAKRAI